MRTHKLIPLLVVIFISILTSCTSSTLTSSVTPTHQPTQLPSPPLDPTIAVTSPTATAHSTVASTGTSQPTPIITPTASPTDTVTPIPSPTATPLPTNLSIVCEEGLETESLEYVTGLSGVLGGIIPLGADLQEMAGNSVIIGGDPLQERDFLPLRDIEPIGFSPDGNWFAYQKYPTREEGVQSPSEPFVYLLSATGQTSKTPIPLRASETNGYWFSAWINNELMMLQYFPGPPGSSGSFFADSYAIFNVFTGERHDEFFENLPYWSGWTVVYFSPDMTRAVYISDPLSEINTSIVLWDAEQQNVLWYKKFAGERFDELYLGSRGFRQTAFWSPDSSGFVFTTGEQLSGNETVYSSYFVDRDGKREHVLVNAPNWEGDIIQGGLWSPDGRFIYYYVSWTNKAFIYDLALNHKTEICTDSAGGVTWSPDSNYLTFRREVNGQIHVLLLNVYTGEVASAGIIQGVIYDLEWVANEGWLGIR